MDSSLYGQASSGHLQALDFTSSFKQDNVAQPTMEAHPVLDLSCKKPSAASNLTMHFDERLSSTASDKQTGGHFSDHDSKSPFEGRTFMVTPPSETDSPKKIKYESIFTQNQDQINVIAGESVGHHVYPVAPVGIPIPVTTVLPALIAQNVASNKSNSLPVTTTVTSPALSPELNKKAPRPFKAYPKDPLSLTVGTTELMYDQNSNEAYSEFRKRMLESVRRTNEGTNIKMRRVTKSPGLPTSTVDEKDAAYWERRRKNNEAAKRSRDARRAKEDEIAIRAAFLEQENMKLKYELVALRNETAKLRCMVYSN